MSWGGADVTRTPQGWRGAGATVSSGRCGGLGPRDPGFGGGWEHTGPTFTFAVIWWKLAFYDICHLYLKKNKNSQTFNTLRHLKVTEQEASVLLSEAASHSAGDSGPHPPLVLGESELEDVRVPCSALRIWDSRDNRPVSLCPQKCSNALRPPGGSGQLSGSS